jgi:hypothetical protein
MGTRNSYRTCPGPEKKTIAQRFVEDIFNARKTELIENYVTHDVAYHGMGEEVSGIENFKQWVK